MNWKKSVNSKGIAYSRIIGGCEATLMNYLVYNPGAWSLMFPEVGIDVYSVGPSTLPDQEAISIAEEYLLFVASEHLKKTSKIVEALTQ